jgi:hypothetical protein
MRMPYVKRTTKAGRTIENEKYYTSRYKKKGTKKSDKVKATNEQQKKINTRQAERRLRLLINENYVTADYHLVLGYVHKRGDPYRTKEEMRSDMDIFFRLAREEYRKAGLVLKYIHVMEIGKRGARHHHLVINKADPELIQSCWEHGRIRVFPMDDTGQYSKLANYLIKYTEKTIGTDKAMMGKRWNSSQNLRKPEPEYEIISDREWIRSEAKPIKGYYVDSDSVESGIHNPEYSGYGFFRYTLIKEKDAQQGGGQCKK